MEKISGKQYPDKISGNIFFFSGYKILKYIDRELEENERVQKTMLIPKLNFSPYLMIIESENRAH